MCTHACKSNCFHGNLENPVCKVPSIPPSSLFSGLLHLYIPLVLLCGSTVLGNSSATDFFSMLAVRGQSLGLIQKGRYLVQKSALALMGTSACLLNCIGSRAYCLHQFYFCDIANMLIKSFFCRIIEKIKRA